MSGNGGPQLLVAAAGAVVQQVGLAAQNIPLDAPPGLEGEQPGVDAGRFEIITPAHRSRGFARLFGRGRGRRQPLQLLHHKTAAGLGFQITLCGQHLVRRVHGVHAQLQLLSQPPLGWQFFPRGQPPRTDGPHKVGVQLLVQRRFAVRLGHKHQVFHGNPPI